MQKSVLVTGANGFLGSFLVDALIEKGIKTRVLVRKTSNLEWLNKKAEIFLAILEISIVYHLLLKILIQSITVLH